MVYVYFMTFIIERNYYNNNNKTLEVKQRKSEAGWRYSYLEVTHRVNNDRSYSISKQ